MEIRKLGQGSHGDVYLVKLQNGNQIAVKKSSSKNGISASALIEVECLNRLKQESCVAQILSVFTHKIDGRKITKISIVFYPESMLDYIHKSSREDRLSNVKYIVDQMIHILSVLKYHRIIHRDIKPGNIMMENYVLKLCDFSLSCSLYVNGSHPESFDLYTRGYRPPEICAKIACDYSSDTWSAGATIFEYITGTMMIRPDSIRLTTTGVIPPNDAELLCIHRISENGIVKVKGMLQKRGIVLGNDIIIILQNMLIINHIHRLPISNKPRQDIQSNMTECLYTIHTYNQGIQAILKMCLRFSTNSRCVLVSLDIYKRYSLLCDERYSKYNVLEIALGSCVIGHKIMGGDISIKQFISYFDTSTYWSITVGQTTDVEEYICNKLNFVFSTPEIIPLAKVLDRVSEIDKILLLSMVYKQITSEGIHPSRLSYEDVVERVINYL